MINPRMLRKITLYPLSHWMQNISLPRAIYGRIGQEFWEEITGAPDFYMKLIDLIDKDVVAKKRREYQVEWDRAINKHVGEFTQQFCGKDGAINWKKLIEFNSGKIQPSK
jgi:hypothetical protein